jgi:hypothetical protein
VQIDDWNRGSLRTDPVPDSGRFVNPTSRAQRIRKHLYFMLVRRPRLATHPALRGRKIPLGEDVLAGTLESEAVDEG